jgi:hypothetical protein
MIASILNTRHNNTRRKKAEKVENVNFQLVTSLIVFKFQLPISDVITFLLHQFSDPNYNDMSNYEDLVSIL